MAKPERSIRMRAGHVTHVRWTCPKCRVSYEIPVDAELSRIDGACPTCPANTKEQSMSELRNWIQGFRSLQIQPIEVTLEGDHEGTVDVQVVTRRGR